MSAATSRRIRAVFGAANFWAIVLYNILALNSLEFALLVTKRLLVTGKVPEAFPTEQSLSWWADMGCGLPSPPVSKAAWPMPCYMAAPSHVCSCERCENVDLLAPIWVNAWTRWSYWSFQS